MKKCKITILKTLFYQDLADKYITLPDFGKCPAFKEGEEYITEGPFGFFMPKGFCEPAWDAISKLATALVCGGEIYGSEINIACCNDGVRPVIFKLEVIED